MSVPRAAFRAWPSSWSKVVSGGLPRPGHSSGLYFTRLSEPGPGRALPGLSRLNAASYSDKGLDDGPPP